MPIHHLVAGVHSFKASAFRSRQELFEGLGRGQHPDALFITCSDSRIDPNLLTQMSPGSLFTIRNAGNIVPPYGRSNGGEGPTLEYAVRALGVSDVIVCGHSHCGAMKALLDPAKLVDLPLVASFLEFAEGTRRIMWEAYRSSGREQLLELTIQENVLVQLESLRSYPFVAERLDTGTLKLHGWYYVIETAEVFLYDPARNAFTTLDGG